MKFKNWFMCCMLAPKGVCAAGLVPRVALLAGGGSLAGGAQAIGAVSLAGGSCKMTKLCKPE